MGALPPDPREGREGNRGSEMNGGRGREGVREG